MTSPTSAKDRGELSPTSQLASEHSGLLEVEGGVPMSPTTRRNTRRAASGSAQAAQSIFGSWVSRRFMSGVAILLPVVVTAWVIWWFLEFIDGFFSPLYRYLFGFEVFGLGFITTLMFVLATGVFASTWLGNSFVSLGELIIKKVPLVKHVYSAAKQVSAAVNPESEAAKGFRECVIIRHPRHGEYAFGFITGSTTLQTMDGDERLEVVFVPTNHVYVGDLFLLGSRDIIRSSLSVREGIEIVVSLGLVVPNKIATIPGTPLSPGA